MGGNCLHGGTLWAVTTWAGSAWGDYTDVEYVREPRQELHRHGDSMGRDYMDGDSMGRTT